MNLSSWEEGWLIMIENLYISNLKSIKELSVDCSNINLFIGTNSSGKSTILQAILLLAQNINHLDSGLNGRLVRLGNFDEAKCKYSRDSVIKIKVTAPSLMRSFIFKRFNDDEGRIIEPEFEGKDYNFMSLEDRNFQYVSCNRIGPQNIYMKNMDVYETMGIDSEYAISYLSAHGSDPIDSKLCKSTDDFTLLGQVNWWLDYIVDATISLEEIPRADAITVSYSFHELHNIRPTNIGSGISYLISILITCLSMPADGVVIIENPEIHLHPRAQSRICEFLYFVADADRQLFIESHSDHIFNGFRVGITTKAMCRDKINIQFAALNQENFSSIVKVEIDDWGNVVNQKEDLFDQFDIDLNKMLGI